MSTFSLFDHIYNYLAIFIPTGPYLPLFHHIYTYLVKFIYLGFTRSTCSPGVATSDIIGAYSVVS